MSIHVRMKLEAREDKHVAIPTKCQTLSITRIRHGYCLLVPRSQVPFSWDRQPKINNKKKTFSDITSARQR